MFTIRAIHSLAFWRLWFLLTANAEGDESVTTDSKICLAMNSKWILGICPGNELLSSCGYELEQPLWALREVSKMMHNRCDCNLWLRAESWIDMRHHQRWIDKRECSVSQLLEVWTWAPLDEGFSSLMFSRRTMSITRSLHLIVVWILGSVGLLESATDCDPQQIWFLILQLAYDLR